MIYLWHLTSVDFHGFQWHLYSHFIPGGRGNNDNRRTCSRN